jgi:arsenite methyltransferase
MKENKKQEEIREAVKKHYAGRISSPSCMPSGCCGESSLHLDQIGAANYSSTEMANIPADAVQNSFGCGNPLAYSGVREGDTVVDIGSGAGLDAILAARAVGPAGHVFGIDMTEEMIQRAEENVARTGLANITFLLGEAEDIPLAEGTADWVISNCVINLSPDKERVFGEIHRILKPGGRVLISDIVAENLPSQLRENMSAWSGCIAGAIDENAYLQAVASAGFRDINVLDRVEHSLTLTTEAMGEILPEVNDDIVAEAVKAGTRVASIRLYAEK